MSFISNKAKNNRLPHVFFKKNLKNNSPGIWERLSAFLRQKNGKRLPGKGAQKNAASVKLQSIARQMQAACTGCGVCKKKCTFLAEYGSPLNILEKQDTGLIPLQEMAFECSLCGFCSAVCPEGLDPGYLFFQARKQAVETGRLNLSTYRRVLNYEKKGVSALFSWYGLPQACDTVFFPGCTLTGTRPETTLKLFRHLQRFNPSLGIVLDCCTKISHDLGRQDFFDGMFSEMLNYLRKNNIKKIWVACPNCYKIFNTYGRGLVVETVYEELARTGLPESAGTMASVVVHDPCSLRDKSHIHKAVRILLDRMGVHEKKMHCTGGATFCCGEGGSVGQIRPDLAESWIQRRVATAKGEHMVTYCAGCAGFLGRVTCTSHLLDLVFNERNGSKTGSILAKAPFTYLNRLFIKMRLKNLVVPAVQRVRPQNAETLAQQIQEKLKN